MYTNKRKKYSILVCSAHSAGLGIAGPQSGAPLLAMAGWEEQEIVREFEHKWGEGTPKMLVSERRIRVEWGNCDPAQIVFYPNYMVWFDACMTSLFALAGLPLPTLFAAHKIVGIPVVDVKVKFHAPARFGDELRAVSTVTQFGRSSFVLRHQFFEGDVLVVEGFETRVWTGHDPHAPGHLKSRPLPKEIIEKLSASK